MTPIYIAEAHDYECSKKVYVGLSFKQAKQTLFAVYKLDIKNEYACEGTIESWHGFDEVGSFVKTRTYRYIFCTWCHCLDKQCQCTEEEKRNRRDTGYSKLPNSVDVTYERGIDGDIKTVFSDEDFT